MTFDPFAPTTTNRCGSLEVNEWIAVMQKCKNKRQLQVYMEALNKKINSQRGGQTVRCNKTLSRINVSLDVEL